MLCCAAFLLSDTHTRRVRAALAHRCGQLPCALNQSHVQRRAAVDGRVPEPTAQVCRSQDATHIIYHCDAARCNAHHTICGAMVYGSLKESSAQVLGGVWRRREKGCSGGGGAVLPLRHLTRTPPTPLQAPTASLALAKAPATSKQSGFARGNRSIFGALPATRRASTTYSRSPEGCPPSPTHAHT